MLLNSSRIVTVVVAGVMVLAACNDRPDVAYKELLADDPQVRADAVVRLGQARADDAVDSLVALLDDPDEVVRLSVVRALAQIGDPVVVPDLARYADDPLNSVRQQICQALGAIGSPDGIGALEKMLYDPDGGIRLTAARNLGLIDHPRALEVLIETALYDENEVIRQNAVKVIGRRKAVEAIPALIDGLHDPFHKVRSISAHSLRAIAPDDPRVARALADQLAVEEAGVVRVDLSWNLVLVGEKQHLELLRSLLFQEGPEDVRAEAARALGEVGQKSDIELLEKALEDKEGLVRTEVFKAIEKLKEA